ncbi:MAG: hypothetical protein J7K62_00220, partial [Thermoplasmata archaeon]|nr:hypothetical protein [Thermoplasmata archaeon]
MEGVSGAGSRSLFSSKSTLFSLDLNNSSILFSISFISLYLSSDEFITPGLKSFFSTISSSSIFKPSYRL